MFQQRPSKGWGSPGADPQPAHGDRRLLRPAGDGPELAEHCRAGVAADRSRTRRIPSGTPPRKRLRPRWSTGSGRAPTPTQRCPGHRAPGRPSPARPPPRQPRPRPGRWPPACPDDGESDLPAIGPLDRSALPPGFTLPADPEQQRAVAFALAQVGKPYVFGAKGPDTFDCSGLMQAAWAAAGVGISAGTLTQIHDGVAVAGLADLRPRRPAVHPGVAGHPDQPATRRHIRGSCHGHRGTFDQDRCDFAAAQRLACKDCGDPAGRSGPGRRSVARFPRPCRVGGPVTSAQQRYKVSMP